VDARRAARQWHVRWRVRVVPDSPARTKAATSDSSSKDSLLGSAPKRFREEGQGRTQLDEQSERNRHILGNLNKGTYRWVLVELAKRGGCGMSDV